ncbi:MAG: peptidoglycan-binding domain-containing protein [Egibacteraceae bacterium]
MATVSVTVKLDVIDLSEAHEPGREVTGRHVGNLQGLLLAAANSAGDPDFDPKGIDGVAGQETRRALRRFKEQHDLRNRFICDAPTWERLIEYPHR